MDSLQSRGDRRGIARRHGARAVEHPFGGGSARALHFRHPALTRSTYSCNGIIASRWSAGIVNAWKPCRLARSSGAADRRFVGPFQLRQQPRLEARRSAQVLVNGNLPGLRLTRSSIALLTAASIAGMPASRARTNSDSVARRPWTAARASTISAAGTGPPSP